MVQDPQLSELVTAATAGDGAAQAALFAAFSPMARARAARLIDDHDSVNDVVQEAFVEVFATIGRLRRPEAFPTWVWLAVRKHAERHRRQLRPTETLADELNERMLGADSLAEQWDLAIGVRAVLLAARDSDRRLVELRYLAGWSTDELAEALDISTGAVRKRLHDARTRLRPAMSQLIEREDSPMTDYHSFLGRLHRPGELDLPDRPHVARPEVREPFPTGLKILDAIAPIGRGGTVELVGPAGTGQLVVGVELGHRIARGSRRAAVIGVGSAQRSSGAWSNLHKLVDDEIEHDRHAVIVSDDDEGARVAVSDGRALAEGLADTGVEALLVIDHATAAAVGGPATLKDLAGVSAGGGSVTLLYVNPYGPTASPPVDAGMDTRLVFSAEMAAAGIFPAIDPVESRASFVDSAIAEDVRAAVRAGEAVRRYFKQEMIVAEEHTGESPTWVEQADAEAALRDLLATAGPTSTS